MRTVLKALWTESRVLAMRSADFAVVSFRVRSLRGGKKERREGGWTCLRKGRESGVVVDTRERREIGRGVMKAVGLGVCMVKWRRGWKKNQVTGKRVKLSERRTSVRR